MPQYRDALRERASRARHRAETTRFPVVRHLLLAAAKRFDAAAAEAVYADHLEVQAERYEREPGGEPGSPPPVEPALAKLR